MGEDMSTDPYSRLLVSFAVFYTYLKRGRNLGEARCFTNLGDVASLYLGNVLLAICFDLLYHSQIKAQYDRISFAARDGYLPKIIYDILADGEKASPSHYFLASRQALSYTTYKDYFDYFDHIPWKSVFVKYRLEDYIHFTIVDRALGQEILSAMTGKEKAIDLSCQMLEARAVLLRFKEKLNAYFTCQSVLAKSYYHDQFPEKGERYLVFDCGYSGSVSLGLSGACSDYKPKFDKYYIWETDTNRDHDENNGTQTYCLTQSKNFSGINIVVEECFSPFEGTCLGFKYSEKGTFGVQERMPEDEGMKKSLEEIRQTCEEYAREFKKLFDPYIDCFLLTDRDIITRIGGEALAKSPYMEVSLFKSIRFSDSLNGGIPIELSKKVYDVFAINGSYQTVFHGTQFCNPDSMAKPIRKTNAKFRIGIHLHIHYLYVLEELICYLRDFPVPFDLIITTTNPHSKDAIEQLCSAILLNMNKVVVIPVENRGRDVAPWLVATRPYQENYDLFCHLHGKASVEYNDGVGTKWRRYLFDNLIAKDAAADILNLFEEDENIGCVFPQYYSDISKICVSCNIPLKGAYGEEKIIENLMEEMHINRRFSRDDMLYSCGTMLWYRPRALQPLFDINLTFDRFPEEPIPNGGTLAHAIERVPGLVCSAQGYRAVLLNEIPQSAPYNGQSTTETVHTPEKQCKRSWRGHPIGWYMKKTIKSIVPYGVIRIWQRKRYNI